MEKSLNSNPWTLCFFAILSVFAIIGCKVVDEINNPIVVSIQPQTLTNTIYFAVSPTETNYPPVKIIGNVVMWDWSIGNEIITNYPIYVGGQKVEFDVEYAISLRQWKLLGHSFSNSFRPVPTNLTTAYFRVGVHTIKRK